MSHVLLVSHTPTPTTGYGRVTRRLAHAFREAGHQVAVLGSGYNGGPHELPYPIFPWPDLSPAPIAAAIRDLSPDLLLTIGDPWMSESLPAMPQRRGRSSPQPDLHPPSSISPYLPKPPLQNLTISSQSGIPVPMNHR